MSQFDLGRMGESFVEAHNSLFDEDEDQTLLCKYLVSHAENENGSRVLLNKTAECQVLFHDCLERIWVRAKTCSVTHAAVLFVKNGYSCIYKDTEGNIIISNV